MNCFSVFNGSIATSRKGYIIYNIIIVVYFSYVLAGFDSQQFLILVCMSTLFYSKTVSSKQQHQRCLYKKRYTISQ